MHVLTHPHGCLPNSTSTRSPRILCVDDDPDIQTAIELRMRKYDVEVEHAFYGMQGIVEAAQCSPDLILMDQAMPHGNGEYLLEAVKSNPATSAIPVIVLTGMRDPNLKHRLMQAGAEAYLNKPVHFDELVHHISRFIDLREREVEGE
ncbi:response regulator [Aeoliella sp.]|uniref:response regulator n=1 Tax=Aeoliella sp. TaxID=2795800 RepID=UPI003CCBE9CF